MTTSRTLSASFPSLIMNASLAEKENCSIIVWPPYAAFANMPSFMSPISWSKSALPGRITVFLILTIGANLWFTALAFPVVGSPILAAVSLECSLPTSRPLVIRGAVTAGVPSSSYLYEPRSPAGTGSSATLRKSCPKRRPSVIIFLASSFSAMKSDSDRCPNASWMNTPARCGSQTTV